MPITKQTIAIVGAGSAIGSNIARSICAGNYRLLLISDDISAVRPLAKGLLQSDATADIGVMNCQFDACWEADIIIMAVPYSAYEKVAAMIKKVAAQKIVIGTANPANQDLDELEASSQPNVAEELQQSLPNSKIVEAFNTVASAAFDLPDDDRKQVDVSITGDNDEALKTVSELVRTAGFNPAVARSLSVKGHSSERENTIPSQPN